MELLFVLLLIIFIALAIIIASASSKNKTEREITAAGKQGEERTAYLLHSLPDNYILIRNAVINYEGRKSEIDNIVVGATGVFVVETKNHKGYIYGDCHERYWLQYKIDDYGIDHRKYFYNPTKQVATHIYRLKGIFKENKIYIENPREDIPVFNYYNQDELLNYILSRKEILTDEQVEYIVKITEENDSYSF